jgi:hypothetical protein
LSSRQIQKFKRHQKVKQAMNIGVQIMSSRKSLPINSVIDKLEKNIADTPIGQPSFADAYQKKI